MRKLKILIIIPNLGRGGAQLVFRQQIQYLSPHFHVLGCVFNWDGAFKEDETETIVSLNVPGGHTWLHKVYYFILRIHRLRELKKDKNTEISISHLEGADYVNLLSRGSDRVICWIHGTKKFDQNIKGVLGLIRHHILMPLIYRRAEKIVTVSRGIQDEFENNFRDVKGLLKTVYNGFDLESIQSQSLEPVGNDFIRLANTSKVIITHCRLSKQKNLIALVYIFQELIKITSSKLVIVGDGELREDLLYECKQLGLKTWSCWGDSLLSDSYDVYFLGQQKNPFKYLRHASLFMMTSGWEGFPLALCEAMLCGLPVIAADCYTGPREILAPGLKLQQPVNEPHYGKFGVLMPLVDYNNSAIVNVWAKAALIIENKELVDSYSVIGVDRIKEFDLKTTIKQTIEIIRTA